jgi:hypothetical protein
VGFLNSRPFHPPALARKVIEEKAPKRGQVWTIYLSLNSSALWSTKQKTMFAKPDPFPLFSGIKAGAAEVAARDWNEFLVMIV